MKSRNALAVMCKSPVPGCVKTRLTPALTSEEAAALYACFIKDLFARVSPLECAETFAAYASVEGDKEGLLPLIGTDVEFIAQHGSGLGERIANLFKELFSRGYGRVVVIGSDSPDIPCEYIEEAFEQLDERDMVIGPALDGGYYLIGLTRPIDGLFGAIEWSTDRVLAQTLRRAEAAGAAYSLLKPWYDIDTPDDLRLLESNPMTPESTAFIKALFFRG